MDILITCYFVNCFDFQRGNNWQANKADLQPLINSLKGQTLIILNDCYEDCIDNNVIYKRAETSISPYFQRWVSIYQYLRDNPEIEHAFCIDATDVELLKNPFKIDLGGYIYVGDEPGKLDTPWMRKYHKSKFIQRFLNTYGKFTTMNAGICGGNRELLLSFIHKIISVYFDNKADVFYKRNGALDMDSDMAIFNYVAYTFFSDKIKHGRQINTEFKKYEYNNVSFFKHK